MSGHTHWRSEREGRNGTYRGVPIEVTRWRTLNADGTPYVSTFTTQQWTWNYYLFIAREALPERLLPEFDREPEGIMFGDRERKFYRAPSIVESLDWHGGLTLFEKLGGADGMPAVYKAGCDYNHSWDEGVEYGWSHVAFDAEGTVNALLEAIPDLLVRCGYTGKFHAQDDGVWCRDGSFQSWEGIQSQFAYAMKRRAEVSA